MAAESRRAVSLTCLGSPVDVVLLAKGIRKGELVMPLLVVALDEISEAVVKS